MLCLDKSLATSPFIEPTSRATGENLRVSSPSLTQLKTRLDCRLTLLLLTTGLGVRHPELLMSAFVGPMAAHLQTYVDGARLSQPADVDEKLETAGQLEKTIAA